jgi:HK97 gp10 family phage protein
MMAETVEFSILGLDSLTVKLESVTYDMKRKGGRSALRRAAAVIAENAKARAMLLDDAETGRSIADNIVLRWNGRLFKRTGDLGFRIGVKHGAVLKDGGELSANSPTPHWRLLEFGTQYIRADPFMRPALEESISDATNVFVTEYEKTIDRAIKRAARASGGG